MSSATRFSWKDRRKLCRQTRRSVPPTCPRFRDERRNVTRLVVVELALVRVAPVRSVCPDLVCGTTIALPGALISCHNRANLIGTLLISSIAVGLPSQPAFGQDRSEAPNGVICMEPDCDIRKSLPKGGLFVPLQAEPALTKLVKETLASDLDSRLPAAPFEQWLRSIVYSRLAANRTEIADWGLGLCEDRVSAIPGAGPDLCVDVSSPLAPEFGAPRGGGLPVLLGQRLIKISVGVANGVFAPNGRTGWLPAAPQIRK